MQKPECKTIRAAACGFALLSLLAEVACAAPAPSAPAGAAVARPAAALSGPADLAAALPRAATASAPDFGAPADIGELERSRGGTDTHNDTRLDGVVTNNTAVNVVTGNNVIDSGSFANMSGIPVVIQNSGANVLIQNSTVINLQLK